jgi:phenylalanyl-tRNA synthetase alpha chain
VGAAAEAVVAASYRIDVTLPGRRPPPGGLNPLTSTMRSVVDAFVSLGYRVSEGPELETEWYNFDALNFPPDHPARLTQDTLYPDVPGRDDLLLRTHTSPVQIRTMEAQAPPI